MNLADLQFRGRPQEVKCASTVLMTNSTIACPLSSRKAGRTKGKVSMLALALDRIVLKQYEVYTDEKSTAYLKRYDTTTKSVVSELGLTGDALYNERGDNTDKLCLVLGALVSLPSGSEETKNALDQCLKEYNDKGSISPRNIGYLCDTFYYDAMYNMGSTPGATTTAFSEDELDSSQKRQFIQAVSTGALSADLFSEIQKPFFGSSSDPFETPVTASGKPFMDACKDGDKEIGYAWDEDSQMRIQPPSFLDTFVPSRSFEVSTNLCYKKLSRVSERLADGKTGLEAIGKDYVNLIYVGKPGTGKTTIANALSATLGLPIYTCRLSKNTEEDEVEGKTKVAEGSLVFKETPFLTGYTNGGILVLEEFNIADPGVMQGALGQAIEAPFILMKDGVEPVRRHPLCVIISTMNTGTQGSKEPNEAFASRHPYVFSVEDPNEDDFVGILAANTGASKKNCKRVYSAYTTIQNYLVKNCGSEDIAMSVTLRHCIGALELLDIEDFNHAIYDTMIGAIKIKDLELAETVYQNCIQSKKY